jgi:dienelactone hydrolase
MSRRNGLYSPNMQRSKWMLAFLLSSVLASGQSVAPVAEADPLPRRGYFGVGLEKAPEGARVFAVSPGSTAAEAGIVAGDVIYGIDGSPAITPESVVTAIGRHRGGEVVTISLVRKGGRETLVATLKPYPGEQMANATLQYSSVTALPSVRLRTIVSVPSGAAGKRYPAVLLIQGGGCGSIDTPLSPDVGQTGLMHAIGSQGFITMRVEKSGVGDSQGLACDSIGFKEELAGYQAALKALRAHPSVDPQKVYLLGISLGGVFAPLLAAETKVAGISVYGTPAAPPPAYPGRSARFFEEFAPVDVRSAWTRVGTRVQVLHGEYDDDPVTNRSAHESIANLVNSSGPGSAEFLELAALDHCWSRHASLEISRNRCGQGENTSALSDAVLAFLRARQ